MKYAEMRGNAVPPMRNAQSLRDMAVDQAGGQPPRDRGQLEQMISASAANLERTQELLNRLTNINTVVLGKTDDETLKDPRVEPMPEGMLNLLDRNLSNQFMLMSMVLNQLGRLEAAIA